jgi:glycosyltransferase involved in cell wall biosynthesis
VIETARRPVVLILLGCFWPGNDSSGPNHSFISLARALGDTFEFRVVARDGATGAPSARADVDRWIDLGFAEVRYRRVGRFGAIGLGQLIAQTPHDVLWLNSMFDREFSLPALALRRLGLIARKPTLLSPRGEFGLGALELKSSRKRLFLGAARRLDLWRGVTLHATSEAEVADIERGPTVRCPIVVAPNIRLVPEMPTYAPSANGALRVAFVGRITPVKQLDFALDLLGKVGSRVDFDIYGPAEDGPYWRRCRKLISTLPENVRVTWRGETANAEILRRMAETDLFFLPTAGENFGHAIFEALACGVPVLVSDQTPWRGLAARRAGWDLPLAAPETFVETIEAFAAMPEDQRRALRQGARAVAQAYVECGGAIERNREMLRSLLREGAGR